MKLTQDQSTFWTNRRVPSSNTFGEAHFISHALIIHEGYRIRVIQELRLEEEQPKKFHFYFAHRKIYKDILYVHLSSVESLSIYIETRWDSA